MATIEKRRERKINASKRMALLNRQTEIYERNCSTCPFNDRNKFEECDKCPLSQELREIGEGILRGSNEIRAYDKERLIAQSLETGLTRDMYDKMRVIGMLDAEIIKSTGVSKTEFDKWKHNVLKTKRSKFEMTTEEYAELKKQLYTDEEVAEIKGVSFQILSKWKRNNNISFSIRKRKRIYTEHTKYRLIKQGIVVATGTMAEIEAQTGIKEMTLLRYRSSSNLKRVNTKLEVINQ